MLFLLSDLVYTSFGLLRLRILVLKQLKLMSVGITQLHDYIVTFLVSLRQSFFSGSSACFSLILPGRERQ